MMNNHDPDFDLNGDVSEDEGPIQLVIEGDYTVPVERLVSAAVTVLEQQNAGTDTSLTIVITGDDEVRALNQQYRDIDAPTDVLSFPADAVPEEIAEDEMPYIGDLIIAYPYTFAQAERLGHDFNDSLALLVVHGTLHLLGFDHDTPENRAVMWAAQEQALRALNIPVDMLPPLEE